mgnify:CR=1 FL=1
MADKTERPAITPAELSGDALVAFNTVLDIAMRMHRGHHWAQGTDKTMRCVKAPLTKTALLKHVNGSGSPVGLCPIKPGGSTVQVANLDMDSHKGEVPWEEMCEHAATVITCAEGHGLQAIPFRSTGGRGIHLTFIWAGQQDAYSVRQLLGDVLAGAGFKPGTKGVAKREIEIFPKQDAVPEDGYGSMWILPLARNSVALDPVTLVDTGSAQLVLSNPVTKREKPPAPERKVIETPELKRIIEAVRSLPKQEYDYEHWRNIVFAIHAATDGSDEGLALAQEYNDQKHQHIEGPDWLPEQVWPYIHADGKITVGTLFHHARQAGWADTERALEGFEDVEPADAETGSEIDSDKPAGAGSTLDIDEKLPSLDCDGITQRPPAREWFIDHWLARGVVHTLFAKGSAGKSIATLQMANALVMGLSWFGLPVKRKCKVLSVFCEEDDIDMRWRQWHVREEIDPMREHTTRGLLHLLPRAGEDNNLVRYGPDRVPTFSDFWHDLLAKIRKHRPDVVTLDNAMQLFAGVVNDPSMVTNFVNKLGKIARRFDCAVLLLGHVAKADGSEFMGTMAWENVARIRWFMEKLEDGSTALYVRKSNLGPETRLDLQFIEERMILRTFDRATEVTDKSTNARQAVLAAVKRFQDAGNAVSMSKSGRYLPKVMKSLGLDQGLSTAVLEGAAEALIGAGLIEEGVVGHRANRMPKYGLVVKTQDLADNSLIDKEDGSDLV